MVSRVGLILQHPGAQAIPGVGDRFRNLAGPQRGDDDLGDGASLLDRDGISANDSIVDVRVSVDCINPGEMSGEVSSISGIGSMGDAGGYGGVAGGVRSCDAVGR